MVKRLRETRLRALDEKLFDYVQIDSLISRRKLELQQKDNTDSNIGESRNPNISKPVEALAVRWASDIKIRNLELFQETVKELLKQLNPEQVKIFEMRWLSGRGMQYYTWEEIAEKLNYSRKSMYRKREVILTIFHHLQT